MKNQYIDFETASQLLVKATDDLNLVQNNLPNERQHDNCGYHLAQATEKILKFLCEISGVTYSRDGKYGHSLEALFRNLEKCKAASFTQDYNDLIDLSVYDAESRYSFIPEEERLNLNKYLGICWGFRNEALREYQKLSNS